MAQIFISWSGEPSKTVAHFLREWIGTVMQAAQCWMSGEDIAPGMQWSQAVFDALSSTNLGIICVTHCNQRSPWLNFEAGAVAKAVDASRVIPYLLDLSLGQVRGPLQQFQAVGADEQGTRLMCRSINNQLDRPLTESKLDKSFANCRPELSSVLSNLPEASEEPGRVPASDPVWPSLKTFQSLAAGIATLSRAQRKVLAAICSNDPSLVPGTEPRADADMRSGGSGMYIFKLVELLKIGRPEVFYRCKDLEQMELIQSQALTDFWYSPAPSVTRLAKLGSQPLLSQWVQE